MSTQTRPMTADQLLRLHVPGKHFELVRGELIEMTPPGIEHARIMSRIDRRLGTYVEQHGLGEVLVGDGGFWIEHDPDTVRGPDVAFIAKERVPPGGVPKGYWDGAPDLVVEIVSPGDSATEVQSKVEDWLRAGARAVWVFYPGRRSVVTHDAAGGTQVLFEDDVLDGAPVLPGFTCKVSELF